MLELRSKTDKNMCDRPLSAHKVWGDDNDSNVRELKTQRFKVRVGVIAIVTNRWPQTKKHWTLV